MSPALSIARLPIQRKLASGANVEPPVDRQEAEAALVAAGAASDQDFPLFDAAIACALHEAPGRDAGPARGLAAC